MVLGTGIARWMWAVPSLSKVVYGSAATDCAFDRNANAAGGAKRDESDLRVISCLHDLHTQVHSLERESIGIPELERLLVPARFRLQIARFQLGDHIVRVETRDA